MRQRLGFACFAFMLGLVGTLSAASGLVWPTPHPGFAAGEAPEAYVQATASGRWESALFGCVRNGGNRFHEGLDIAPVRRSSSREATDAIFAMLPGRVAYINPTAGDSGYGRYVVVIHEEMQPALYSLYAHLRFIEDDLRVGQWVEAGQRLGTMGRSASYGIPRSRAHLHLEIGLRLTDRFQPWYDRQEFGSDNEHGRYNGMNLVGLDPLDFFASHTLGEVPDLTAYWGSLPVGFIVEIRLPQVPDFAQRYPRLVTRQIPRASVAGWRVAVTPWGLPVRLTPLTESELSGLRAPGSVRIAGIAPTLLDATACRRMITHDRQGRASLGRGGKQLLELLFGLH